MSASRKNIDDDIVAFIRNNPEGVTSQTLAENFLKFKSPDNRTAHIAIAGILKGDRRCTLGENGLWYTGNEDDGTQLQSIDKIPWAVVYLLNDLYKKPEKILHISIWSPYEAQSCLSSEWLVDPDSLSYEEQEMLVSDYETSFESRSAAISRIAEIVDNRTVLFLSSHHHRTLNNYCIAAGETITDDTMLISQLFQINGMTVPKPLDLLNCYRYLFDREPVLSSAYHYGEALSECVQELLSQIIDKGIITREELEKYEQKKTLCANWTDTIFSLEDIAALPQSPGVYGFKNRKQEYIYVGKAKNLKRRLMSYFRATEESPEKLLQLRRKAYDLKIYHCGSELESLLYEHRLIIKYRPVFNTKMEINERKGMYTPLQDCIILLPHVEKDKGMSIWFRKNQKILIKPFYTDFREKEDSVKQLEIFFFQKKLSAKNTDFPEHEIVFRWVKRHKESLPIIPVHRMSTGEEIYAAIRSYWKSVEGNTHR